MRVGKREKKFSYNQQNPNKTEFDKKESKTL